jgi:hypothetical protein
MLSIRIYRFNGFFQTIYSIRKITLSSLGDLTNKSQLFSISTKYVHIYSTGKDQPVVYLLFKTQQKCQQQRAFLYLWSLINLTFVRQTT